MEQNREPTGSPYLKRKKKLNLDTNPTPFTKINSKCTLTLNVKFNTINFQKKREEFGFGRVFRYNTKSIRKKINIENDLGPQNMI